MVTREWNATAYERLSNPQTAWGSRVLDRAPVRGCETVLDAGCGTGRVTAELLHRLPHGRVVALDISSNMLQQARTNLLSRFAARVEFVNADLLNLPFGAVFDGVFSTATFHWVLEHERLFAEIQSVLKPGGWLVAQCGGGPNLKRLRKRASHLLESKLYERYFAGWSGPWEFADASTTAERLRRAGFQDVQTSVEAAPVTFEDSDQFREFIANIICHPYLERISKQELRDRLLNELTSQASSDTPAYTLDYWRLNLSVKKPN
jgi:trans-aconitate 2-methyltransferase